MYKFLYMTCFHFLFFPLLISNFIVLWLENIVYFYCFNFFIASLMAHAGKILCAFGKTIYSVVVRCSVLQISVRCRWVTMLFKSSISWLTLCPFHYWKCGIEASNYCCVFLFLFHQFCFMYFGILLLDSMYVYTSYILLLDWFFYHYKRSLWLAAVFVLKSVFFWHQHSHSSFQSLFLLIIFLFFSFPSSDTPIIHINVLNDLPHLPDTCPFSPILFSPFCMIFINVSSRYIFCLFISTVEPL